MTHKKLLTAICLLALLITKTASSQAFITVWNTANLSAGSTANNQIQIPTVTSYVYNYTINWGDGSSNAITTNTAPVHTYSASGIYTVSITGTFPAIEFNDGGDKLKLLNIQQWGNNTWVSMSSAFYGCANLAGNSIGAPVFGPNCDLYAMFAGCSSFNTSLNTWNMVNVTQTDYMFQDATSFNGNITSWNMSNVTNMNNMFNGATAFNQAIGNWNTTAVTDMNSMFYAATSFNQAIGTWSTNAVTNMSSIFSGATIFNQPIGAWNTAAVTNMNSTFYGATAFNQAIGSWNTTAVTDMSNMFYDAAAFNQPIGSWNTAAVTVMSNMFNTATAFNQPIGNWNTVIVTNMNAMFANATSFNQAIGNWNTANVTNMNSIFYNATSFNQAIGNWNTANVTSMGAMFYNANTFNQTLGSWLLNPTVNLTQMLDYSGVNCTNYSSTLNGWATNTLTPNGRSLGAIGRNYSGIGITASATLTGAKTWTITGDANGAPTVSVNSGTICSGNNFTIVPSGASTYTIQGGSNVVTPISNSSYTVIGTSTTGCVSANTATSSITVNALPILSASTNNTLICTGQTANLTASGATSYTWNTTATTSVITVSPTVTTIYTLTGTDANGCTANTSITQNVSLCTGIGSTPLSLGEGLGVRLFPNPTQGAFTIQLNSDSKIIITNALGQEFLNKDFNEGLHNITLNEATGIYFVKIITGNIQTTKRLVISK